MFAPRLEIDNSRLGLEFNIVVGDSWTDRLLYWNMRTHFPKWRDTGFVDLRIPASFLDNEPAIKSVGQFLKNRNHITGNGGGSPYAVVRSSSIPRDKLKSFSAKLKEHHSWSVFRVEQFTSEEACIPPREILANSSYLMTDTFIGRSSNVWSETSFQEDEIRISPPAPDHLRYASTALLSPYEGAWAVDLDIERKIDYSRFSNLTQRWRLPRRLRMTASFVNTYDIEGRHGHTAIPRVARGGLLTLYANSRSKFPIIHRQTTTRFSFVPSFKEEIGIRLKETKFKQK